MKRKTVLLFVLLLTALFVHAHEDMIGKAWQQTWVTFHFDADGKLTRRIKRFSPDEATNSIRVLWNDWKIGAGISPESALGETPE